MNGSSMQGGVPSRVLGMPRDVASLVALFVVAILAVGLILVFESQVALFSLLVILIALWIGSKRSGLAGCAAGAVTRHPALPNLLVLAGTLALVAAFYDEHYVLLMIATVLLYASACVGINIQTGLTGLANFAGAAFFTCGGYTLAVLMKSTTISHLSALLAGGVAAAAIGMVLLLPVLRTKGYYSALVTIAFGVLFSSFLQVNETLGGAQGMQLGALDILGWDMASGITLGDYEISFYFAYVILALLVFLLASTLARAVEWSFIGVNLDATRSDELVSSSFGISLQRWKITAFLLGNFIIGIAGAVYGGMSGFVSPTGATFEHSLLLISIVVLGGIGNTWGALIAATVVILVPEKLHALQEYRFLIFSILVVVILLFSPKGLIPRAMRDFSAIGGKHG